VRLPPALTRSVELKPAHAKRVTRVRRQGDAL
jgi:hypothetical protein